MQNLRALFLLFAANTISGFAQGITMLAIPWYLVRDMGGDDGKFLLNGMVAIITLLSLFWGIYAGTLVDKYNRKNIFQVMNGIDALVLLAVAAFGFSTGTMPFYLIALVYCGTIFTYNVHYPNLYAFVQELFEPQYYSKVNSAIEIQGQTTNFLGMMTAGFLLSGSPDYAWWPKGLTFVPWELTEIFLLDGLTYILGLGFITLIPYVPKPGKQIDTGPVWDRITTGFQYLWENRPLLIFGTVSHFLFFSLIVLVQVAMPIYISDHLMGEAFVLANFKGLYAVGAIIAGILGFSVWIRRSNSIKQIIFLLTISGIIYFVMASTRSVPLTLFVALLLGICNAGTRIFRITYIVRIVPNHVIGRVNSFFVVVNVFMRFVFISLLTIPFFSSEANGGNIVYAFGLLGLIMLAGALTLVWYFNRFDKEAAVG